MSARLSPLPDDSIREWLQLVVDRTGNPNEGNLANLSETYYVPNPEFQELVRKISEAIDGIIGFDVPRQEAERMLQARGWLRKTSPLPMTSTPIPAGRSPGPACGSPPTSFKNPLLSNLRYQTATGVSLVAPGPGRRLSLSGTSSPVKEKVIFTSLASLSGSQYVASSVTMPQPLSVISPSGIQHAVTRRPSPEGKNDEEKSTEEVREAFNMSEFVAALNQAVLDREDDETSNEEDFGSPSPKSLTASPKESPNSDQALED